MIRCPVFRPRTRAAWLVALVALAPGCAGRPARTEPLAPWRSRSTTTGSDLLRAPRGITIGPPSLGVDLVRRPNPGPVDGAAIPASLR